jgi:hypothetical protein
MLANEAQELGDRAVARVASTRRPPLRQTRASSAAAPSWFYANMTPKVEITPSKQPSATGRLSASAS